MIAWENVVSFFSGAFPDALAINSTGAATQDGTEWIAELINNGMFGTSQALMDWAQGTQGNTALSATPGVPDGVTEAAGHSQILEAIQKGHGIGPGIYKQYGKFDDPSVTGDRILLLSEQGVLIATYSDLDDACWIGGNTAAQVAAEAAGEKFYRSSDVGGAVGDAAGPYIQLPPANPTFLKEYSEAAGDFTVAGANWTTTRAVITPYQDSTGNWRATINIRGFVSVATANLTVTISGLTFRSGADQAVTGWHNTGGSQTTSKCLAVLSTGTINIVLSSTVTAFVFSQDLKLLSKPTWADDFSFPWGITY